jgi:SNF family Na+-dependent transporter
MTSPERMSQFLTSFQGSHFRWGVSGLAYLCFVMTMALNTWILSGGIRKGIERAASWGMPVLIGLSVLLTIRVLTLGAPDPSHPENHVWNGMGFIWNPDFTRLTDAKVWLAAAGPIFFTLSVGFGTIQVYASYLRSTDDVVVTGLSTTMVNQWGEVILGSTIALPIAYAFFAPRGPWKWPKVAPSTWDSPLCRLCFNSCPGMWRLARRGFSYCSLRAPCPSWP